MHKKSPLLYFSAFLGLLLCVKTLNAQSYTITTVAGNGTSGFSGDGRPATAAELAAPSTVSVDASGIIYIGDASNNRIRKISGAGIISSFAGTGSAGFSGDGGSATSAELNNSIGVGADYSGNIYIADEYNQRVRMVNAPGYISAYAGNG